MVRANVRNKVGASNQPGNQIDIFVRIINTFDTTVDGRNPFDIEEVPFLMGFHNRWLARSLPPTVVSGTPKLTR